MKFRRTLAVAALGAAVAVAPLVPAAGVQVLDAKDVIDVTVPEKPEAPSIPSCSEQYTNACLSQWRDANNRPMHKVCVRDDLAAGLFSGWQSSELLCAQTEHFAYLPGPGVCLGSDRVSNPTACVNGNDCTLWVAGVWVLCDEVP